MRRHTFRSCTSPYSISSVRWSRARWGCDLPRGQACVRHGWGEGDRTRDGPDAGAGGGERRGRLSQPAGGGGRNARGGKGGPAPGGLALQWGGGASAGGGGPGRG